MSIAKEFNALNGMIVTRKDLEKLLEKAEKERHTIISKRVIRVLEAFKDDTFLIELRNLVEPYGLNGVDIDGNTSLLDGLEFIPETKDIGLGKPVSPNEIYDMVTQRMIDLIKEANKGDYKRAWKEEGYLIPYNFVSKKAYRGVNVFMLSPMFGLLDNPYYLTFNQIQEKGGKLKKGSHAHKVVYFSTFNKEYSDAEIEKLNTIIVDNKLEKGDEKTIFFLKYYNVFNGADIEGIDFDLDNFPLQGKVVNNEVETGNNETIDIAEAIVKNYPKPQPEILFLGSGASYIPDVDMVKMPDISKFKTSQDFYRTLFHELSHSTGHESRLKRPFRNPFGTPEYAFEELIAEFGAVFLSAQAGIMFYTNKNHAGYLKGWNEVLLPNLENDNRFLMKASSQAQKATDFILQPDAKGDFLFMKDGNSQKQIQNLKSSKPKAKKSNQLELFEGLKGTAKTVDTIAFNKQILEAKRNGFSKIKIFQLGRTKSELWKITGNNKITLSGAIIKKAMTNKDKSHNVKWEHLINLPDNINEPVAIFKSENKIGGFVVLTEVKSHLEKPFMVAIHTSNDIKINDIRSIYSRTGLVHYKNWYKKGLLLYGNEKSELFKLIVGTIPTKFKNPLTSHKDTKKGLNAPKTIAKTVAKEKKPVAKGILNTNSLAYKMANKPTNVDFFKIENKDISDFLGQIEHKQKESVVISLTGGQGSMKTRMCFQFMNALAQNYKVGHASIEEHPESNLYFDKAEQYLNTKALNNIEAPEIKTIAELENLIKKNDVIVIDSFTKMQEMHKGFEVDKDLRKKYDGKLFIVIFQQTTDGKMRGGSKSQFDADIVLFTEKKDDYRENYIYADKNRYQNKPLDGLKFNIFNKKLQGNTPETTGEPTEKRKLSFIVS
ncbi:zincin-like metallopeptidase domain-containing protein [Flavobacterium praedii]|uniref:zincin-like metallopeptidase domain-containing protein n=1 Tax=Flavobacterium praedii TaxID=3002900 RepID=UPI002481C3E5|nr:zincin-like metallopeptidase domain-containing protein [Flavobacterium praedii]